jgi:hypothetical protein
VPKDYRIISAQKRVFLDEFNNPVDGYHIEFVLLNTMARSYVDVPVALFTKELRDKMITEEVARLQGIVGS